MSDTRGRYLHDVTVGMWVKAWSGWHQVDSIDVDRINQITLWFTDGTATTLPAAAIVNTSDQEQPQ